MISAVNIAHQAEPQVAANAAQSKATASTAPSQKPTQTASAAAPVDTVQVRSAAQIAAQATSQEILETSAQTAREAAGGDHQAQRLLAKEAAEKG
jgi:hypothetical protein